MKGVRVMVGAATLAALLSGCHGDRIKNTSAATTTTTAGRFPPIPTPGPSDYGAIYFQTMLDYFNGVRAFLDDDRATDERTPPADRRRAVETLADAASNAALTLRGTRWPTALEADVMAAADALDLFRDDLALLDPITLKTRSPESLKFVDDFTTSALAIDRVLPAACRQLQQTQGNFREGCDALLANLKALAGDVAQA